MASWRKGYLHVILKRARSVGKHVVQGGRGRKAAVVETGDRSPSGQAGPG